MGDISKNFSFNEFQCKDGSETPELVKANIRVLVNTILQPLRDHYGVPITILSGYRSAAYNRQIGGARNSQHMTGKAADIKIAGKPANGIADTIEEMFNPRGLGLYRSFVHVDIRSGRRARWNG